MKIDRRERGHLRHGHQHMLTVRAMLVVAVLVLCTGAQSQESSDKKPVSEKQDTATQKKQDANQEPAPSNKVKSEPVQDTSPATNTDTEDKLETDRQIIEYTKQLAVYTEKLSRFTFYLVIATLILGLIGAGQGVYLRRSVKVAEAALTDLERPYVFVDLRETKLPGVVVTATGRPRVNFPQTTLPVSYEFINHGRTPAILTALRQQLVSTEAGRLPDPINPVIDIGEPLPQGMAVGSGERRKFTIQFARTLNIESTFLIGFVRYRDIFERTHLTGFCSKFQFSTNRFTLEGDERYNYTTDG